MSEKINEPVSVDLAYDATLRKTVPHLVKWRNRVYKITQMGLHHTTMVGKTLLHIFSVTDGKTFFRLSFNTENLSWMLEEMYCEN